MSTTVIFAIFCILFCVLLIGVSMISKKWINDSSDFILAGREVSLLLNIMGVAAIGFAGTSIALNVGWTISFGIQGALGFGIIYAVLGIMFYGGFFSKFIRRCGAQTLPEYLEMRYSSRVRKIVAWTTIIGLCGILANNIVSMAGVVSGYVGWPTWATITGVFLLMVIFAYLSGLWAITMTDFVQMIIGVIAVPLFAFLLIHKFGGVEFFAAAYPNGDFWTHGFKGAVLPVLSLKYPSFLTIAILFGAFLVWGNNYYWLRISSCRSERVAKKSFIWAGVVIVVIFYIPLTIIGLYAAGVYPELWAPVGKVASTAAFGVMAKLFPPVLASFFLMGALAASVSTAATSMMGATSTATRDIYQRTINPNATQKQTLRASKVCLVIIAVFTLVLCYFPGGPTYLFAFANAWLGPPAVLLLLGIFWRKFNATGAFWGVLTGMIVMVLLTLADLLKIYSISKVTHVGVVGFVVTIVVAVIVSLLSKPKYYGEPSWTKEVSGSARMNIALDDFDLKVLTMIRYGHGYLSDITDALKVDGSVSNASIEKLDQGGYIERMGLSRSDFYTFKLTEKAESVLPVVPEDEREMVAAGLTGMYVSVLKMTADAPEKLPDFAKNHALGSLEVSSMVTHLVRKGYVVEKGVWKRKLDLTEDGKKALSKYAAKATV